MASCLSGSDAAVTIVQQGATDTWDIIFDPITFTANANGGELDWLVFEDFFAANSALSGASTSSVSIAIGGGAATDYPVNSANGVFNSTLGGIDPNDLLINFAATSLDPAAGQSVVVSMAAGGFQFTSTAVPAITAAPNINVAIWSNNSTLGRLEQTDVVQVAVGIPEPAALALSGLGGLALLLRRKRESEPYKRHGTL